MRRSHVTDSHLTILSITEARLMADGRAGEGDEEGCRARFAFGYIYAISRRWKKMEKYVYDA